MATSITFDTKDLDQGLITWQKLIEEGARIGLSSIGDELLRLATQQVPHDQGMLQNSAGQELGEDLEIVVGFNKEYAAYQHEGSWPDGTHTIKKYQKNRKGHYLSDPLNIPTRNPAFQVMIRSTEYEAGVTKMQSVISELHQLTNTQIEDAYYYNILATNNGGHIGRDDAGHDLFSVNFGTLTR